MWDIDSILWKPAEKKIYILAFGFYEIFFFSRGKKSKPFTNPASLSKSVKNTRILWNKGESTCVYFFSSYFSTGKSQRQRYFSASHVSVWYIGMEQGLFLWRLWFPFPISPTFDFRRYQVKEQSWVEEGQKKKKRHQNSKRWAKKNEDRKRQPVGRKAGGGRDFSKLISWLYNERIWGPEPKSNKHTHASTRSVTKMKQDLIFLVPTFKLFF